jgi:hypothetical protein
VKYRDQAQNWSDVASHSIFLDKLGPTGSVSINNGASTTASRSVTLRLTATDNSGLQVKRYKLGNMVNGVPVWKTNWTAYTPNGSGVMDIADWMLATGPAGPRKVIARFEDQAGNRSGIISDTITYKP